MSKNGETGAAFKEAYASLNAAQKAAVDTIEGPVMVIAGPGTGKTQILTLRIANILLQTDTQPENILAITFTEAGVKAMRERLHRYIGATAYRVNMFTFHGFSERLIRDYPDAYNKIIGGRPASELDKISLLETILDDPSFKLLRPAGDPGYYIPHLIRILSTLKQEYITPDRLSQLIQGQEQALSEIERVHQKGAHKGKVRSEYTKREKSIAKNHELLAVYRQYEALMKQERLYDFEDMIVETVSALEGNEDMLRDLQEAYQYVLADEHQDVNGSQNRILELLSSFHEAPNIFVVGDEKQAIYRFQGASLDNFLYFTDLFKSAQQIDLTENYRSTQLILDAAHDLVAVEAGPLKDLRIPLQANTSGASTIEHREFSHQAIEDDWLVKTVQSELESGVSAEEVAVIVRTNREVEQVANLLRKAGVPVTASADGDILEHPVTAVVQNFIEATIDSHNEVALFALLHGSFWGLPARDLVRIARARSHDAPLTAILADQEQLASLGVEKVAEAFKVHQTLEQARAMGASESPQRVLEFLLQESGYLDYLNTTDPVEGGRVVRRLYDEVEKLVLHDAKSSLRSVHEVLRNYRTHGIALNAPYIATRSQAVQVMTAHKSKGLEFEVVFIAHVTDRVWGGSIKRTYFDVPITQIVDQSQFEVIDDERRLLYVAMTRAKAKLFISSSEQNQEGKPLTLSRLLVEISEVLLPKVTHGEGGDFDVLAPLKHSLGAAAVDAELFTAHLSERGLSATALNNYLRSPYDYLYRNVLRIPEIQTGPLLYGTAIHAVMEWVSSVIAEKGEIPKIAAVKANLETQLGRLPITTNEFARFLERGLESLTIYLDHLTNQIPKHARTEFTVSVELPTGLPEFPSLKLTGMLDRLDYDEEGNVVRVVDYKTGKPRSRNEIEGKTQSSTGDYKRQLVFYALMLSLYEDEHYNCRTGVLSFIEPTAKAEVKEEVFEITDEEIEELKLELMRITKEIITGEFLKVPCDPATSSYCHLASQLQN